ncbi:MipA/OmpV family protein [Marinomonas algicola]|uniref:MipA/OmpV family protein n=1 Tax=Marinomonas algicola TaxID=2773454 RepID=UPI00174AC538|nr:MipA/OmpV family protein [Marinomonas algicola]
MSKVKSLCLPFVIVLAASPFSLAGDIAQDVRSGESSKRENGGYFGIGLSASNITGGRVYDDGDNVDDYVGITIGGDYYYNGFFIEASQGTSDGLNLGYNFFNKGRWSLDLLASSVQGKFDDEVDEKINSLDENVRNDALQDRNTLYNGAGIRATAHFDDYIFQYRLVTDIHEGSGMTSTARIGRSWQIQNWNVHGVFSLEYSSEETNNYLYGVSEQESTTRFPRYSLGSSLSYSTEVGVTYPLTEHSVFSSFIRYTDLANSIKESPLMERGNQTYWVSSVSYIF